ncbi:DNA-binding response regulator [Marinobacterium zhoushanense]|uniref:DNA-binding response regulator n=1 Tax=Marinobacterium zhoushanense TaxID=1679163 RepID=A0ABQ1KTB6_9GAMM|nr:response regulator transcription factor [Marinobacterium zhoushanense]GGC06069.1 DNA-binding response regulator [Marinobacterium zhoushanense]
MTASQQRPILVIEDDRHIAALVKTYLEHEGFQASVATDGEQGLAAALEQQPRLVILDLMLPRLDGWEVCRRLRADSDVPVLVLSARGEEVDRVMGFSIGADDYVVKPFSPRELMERVKAILRRAERTEVADTALLHQGELSLDRETHEARLVERELSLTPTEFRLLEVLMAHPGRVYSRSALLNQINQHGEVVVERVIDVHVGKLRRKIETDSTHPHYIETVRGIGYRFNPQA